MKKELAAGMAGAMLVLVGLGVLIAASTAWGDFIAIPRGTGSGATGRVRWRELSANGTHSVDFKAPDTLAATTAYTWPSTYPAGNGYSLTSTTGGVTSWTNITGGGGGGGLVKLETQTASVSSSIDFTTCLSATYDNYLVKLNNLIPTNNGVNIYLRFSTDGGSSYDSGTNYGQSLWIWSNAGSLPQGLDTTATEASLTGNMGTRNLTAAVPDAQAGVSGDVSIFDVNDTANWKRINFATNFTESGGSTLGIGIQGRTRYQSTSVVNAFQILASASTLDSGTATCYGFAK